ncbi:helix-turn-helix domain-containing protein [Streptomyces sp. NBUA17]|uniref:helix-turn-helix domain-containing protein n=1 Tax=Streptomyces sp. NBUA17 TaxID=3062275 RepID=UPI0037DA05DF
MWRVRRPSPGPSQSGPPFNALAARRLRAGLNMRPEHVAHGIQVSYGLPYVTPDLVTAWERGTVSPRGPELTALAGMLWCSPGELIGRPQSLREHRVARGLAPEDVARAVGLGLAAYQRMEEADDWHGTDRQSALLADALGLTMPDFVVVMGREEKLADLLTSAVTTRWQGCVRPIAKLAPLDRRVLENVLQVLHQDYQGRMSSTLGWGGGTADSGADGRDFLDRIVEHFWSAVEKHP